MANGDSTGFDPAKQIHFTFKDLQWDLLPSALLAGKAAEEDYQAAKDRGLLPNRARKGKRRRPEERLRVVDPW